MRQVRKPRAGIRRIRRWYADDSAVEPDGENVSGKPEGQVDPKPKDDDKSQDTFPREYVEELRQENASWRTKVRDLEKKFGEMEAAKQSEADKELAEQKRFEDLWKQEQAKRTELEQQLSEQQAQLTRVKIAAEFNLPDDLAERLKGDDEDALRADAKTLAKYAPKPETTAPDDDQDEEQDEPDKNPNDEERRRKTTAAPGGPPVGRTDADRRAKYFSSSPRESPLLSDIDVVMPLSDEG